MWEKGQIDLFDSAVKPRLNRLIKEVMGYLLTPHFSQLLVEG